MYVHVSASPCTCSMFVYTGVYLQYKLKLYRPITYRYMAVSRSATQSSCLSQAHVFMTFTQTRFVAQILSLFLMYIVRYIHTEHAYTGSQLTNSRWVGLHTFNTTCRAIFKILTLTLIFTILLWENGSQKRTLGCVDNKNVGHKESTGTMWLKDQLRDGSHA